MPGVYISVPFCAQKCTYCNFASGVTADDIQREYFTALEREIASHRWDWTPETVYLGGGTPSMTDPAVLRSVLRLVPGTWIESTLEAAPGSITDERIQAWREAGINRVSLGVQSFVQREIARTGRKHTAEIVAAEVTALRKAGIADINIDLIAGLAGQTRESWNESLAWIERLSPPHVSVYMLEVDHDSRLGSEILAGGSRFGAGDVPVDDLTAELYETAVDRLSALGIERYEISNFAIAGHQSRHNLKYWRLEPYVGFGADAHSYDGAVRWQNVESATGYFERFRDGQSPRLESLQSDSASERFFVGLRLTSEGMRPRPDEWRRFDASIRRFVEAGLLETDGSTLRLTSAGVMLSNEVFQEFITT